MELNVETPGRLSSPLTSTENSLQGNILADIEMRETKRHKPAEADPRAETAVTRAGGGSDTITTDLG